MNDRKKLLVSLTTVIQVLEDIGCAGVFNEIELKDGTKEKIDCVEEIIKYIDNDLSINPYEFEDLKEKIYVWDDKYEAVIFIYYLVKSRQMIFTDKYDNYIEFEEGRFFPLTKAMEEFENDN